MRVRKLSPSGDYVFGANSLNFYNNEPSAVGQIVKTGLLLWLGEWYLDVTLGMPWLQGVLGKHGQNFADVTVQDHILNTQGVVGITSFASTIDPVTRLYSAVCTIDTQYGVTEVQVSNFVNF